MGSERRATSRAELTQEQLVELRELFDLVDSDGGGTIDADELGGLMALLGMDSDEQTVAALIEEIDEDGNGEVDFAEFVTVMAKRGGGGDYTAKELVAAFEILRLPLVAPNRREARRASITRRTAEPEPGFIAPRALVEALSAHAPSAVTAAEDETGRGSTAAVDADAVASARQARVDRAVEEADEIASLVSQLAVDRASGHINFRSLVRSYAV